MSGPCPTHPSFTRAADGSLCGQFVACSWQMTLVSGLHAIGWDLVTEHSN